MREGLFRSANLCMVYTRNDISIIVYNHKPTYNIMLFENNEQIYQPSTSFPHWWTVLDTLIHLKKCFTFAKFIFAVSYPHLTCTDSAIIRTEDISICLSYQKWENRPCQHWIDKRTDQWINIIQYRAKYHLCNFQTVHHVQNYVTVAKYISNGQTTHLGFHKVT